MCVIVPKKKKKIIKNGFYINIRFIFKIFISEK